MHYDFIILGQGIAGTLLSYELLRRGKKMLVVDNGNPHAASKVAGAVLNPVNGRALWQTRRQEIFQAAALSKYREIEAYWGLPLLTEMPILHVHTEQRLAEYFQTRSQEIPGLLQTLSTAETADWTAFFRFEHGIGRVTFAHKIAARRLLQHCRELLLANNALLTEVWDWSALTLTPEGVSYKNSTAGKLICCEGAAVRYNPYFNRLPFTRNKGEALLIHAPALPQNIIYQRGIRLTPWHEGGFWAGSNQTWDYEDPGPDAAWRAATEKELRQWLKVPFEVTAHLFAERPTTAGQLIFAEAHPEHPQLVLFNGLGTRGFSAGPYQAAQLAAQLCGEAALPLLTHRALTK